MIGGLRSEWFSDLDVDVDVIKEIDGVDVVCHLVGEHGMLHEAGY